MKSHSCAWERYLCLAEKFPNKFIQYEDLFIELDEQKVIQYEEKYQVTIGVIYESPYNTLVVDLVHNQDGHYFTYERLLPTVEKGACVMLPIYNGRIIIMKQYRHTLRDYQYAIPRGFAEQGLTAEQNCQKEMMEELGGSIHSLLPLGVVVADSGISGNSVQVFACHLDSYHPQIHHEGIEEILELSQEEFQEWIRTGRITDSYTLSAYTLYLSYLK